MTETAKPQPLVKLCGLYANTSKAGKRYLSGVMGGVKVLVLEDKSATPDGPGWALFVTARPAKKENAR